MLINRQSNFLFVHIQKTAGISIEHEIKSRFPSTEILGGRHSRVIDVIACLDDDSWKRLYKFAFVRNPWDRMLSWYNMIQIAQKRAPFYRKFIGRPFRSDFWNSAVKNSSDFQSFLENCTEVIWDNKCKKSFAYNQIDYLVDNHDNVSIDFIGKFENLDSDFDCILAKLGVTGVSLPKKNQNKHAHYSHYYNSYTRKIIEARFARDISFFDYSFEGEL